MDFELRAAREKLEREQRERKARAKAKMEKEKRAKAEAARQRDALEAGQRAKRLEAERAQLEAAQQMEESLLLGNGISFMRILEAVPFKGQGDKIKLPPSSFEELSGQNALDKGPMYFRLTRVNHQTMAEKPSIAYSGVLEFTASEGTVQLPTHVWQNLFPDRSSEGVDVPLVELRYVSLPKGTYAKLKPEGAGFHDLPNHKAVLETELRLHATLSEGETIRVSYGETQYGLRVLELKPASTVSVIETDIDVDIEALEGENHVLVPLEMGKIVEGIVEEGKFKYYKFVVDGTVSEVIRSEFADLEVKLQADNSGNGDTDIYVSRHPLIFPTQHRHEWSSHETGSKNLVIKHKDPNLVPGNYTIGVYGFKGVSKYQISVHVKDRNVNVQKVGEGDKVNSEDLVECGNCKRHVARRTIVVHEAYCVRHNVVCQYEGCGVVLRREESENHAHCVKCGRAFQKGEMEKHMKVFHEPTACLCGIVLEKEEMVQHQTVECPLRLIVCRFCGDMVQAGANPDDPRDRLRGLCEHESQCGSRTAPCDSCGRSVMLKDMDLHNIAVHQKN
ncbi:Ubiquitin fusion degradation protein 1-like protein [Rhynchospora pubera]|uniref:Ubiquitin fusion degradation protein 1-like protein n=1 Tax=Rhynchospora pubera TaxID=906938 RepID=A0AAV8EQ60_9POAL|nr:Ubiquitin fusion degradation protein 1-like protein [Rhynchospora pubera]